MGESRVLFFLPLKSGNFLSPLHTIQVEYLSNPFGKDDHYDERHCKNKEKPCICRAAERRGGSGFRAVCVSESGKLLDSGGGAVFGAEEEVVF